MSDTREDQIKSLQAFIRYQLKVKGKYGNRETGEAHVQRITAKMMNALGDEALPKLVTDEKLINELNNMVVEKIKEQAK